MGIGKMLDIVRRFWQQRASQASAPRQVPKRPVARDESLAPPKRQARAEFAFASTDVGNYA
jgi:hypothetical protein